MKITVFFAILLVVSSCLSQEPHFLFGNRGNINSVAFSPDSKTIASGDENGNLVFTDIQTLTKELSIESAINITCINYSPAGTGLLVYTSLTSEVTVMKAATKEIVKNFKKTYDCYCAVFSPDGSRLAVAYLRQPTKKEEDKGIRLSYIVEIYDTGKYEKLKTLRLSRSEDTDGEIFGSEYFETYRHNAFNCDFSSNGNYLAAGTSGKSIAMYSFEYSKFAPSYKGHSGRVLFVTFSPDGNYLASASKDETLKLWNVTSGNTILTLKGHTNDVNAAAFSPDSKYLASASDDESVKIWDVKTTKLITTLSGFDVDVMTI
ncbi:MAG: hypothetical protein IT281_06360, partial [Ignavibacteria bacterium]|nr:hypothetical protein [Ignavibacteria bacterium]